MTPDRLVTLFAFGTAITLLLGVWWGHVITLRSWYSWWETVRGMFTSEIRHIIRQELEGKDDA